MGPQDSDLVMVAAAGKALVVRFLTDSLLDPIEVERVSDHMHAALEASDTGTMIVELGNISQLSTLMLSVLVSLRAKAQARGGRICLAAIPERVDYVLKLTQLDKAFPTYATVEDAAATLS